MFDRFSPAKILNRKTFYRVKNHPYPLKNNRFRTQIYFFTKQSISFFIEVN